MGSPESTRMDCMWSPEKKRVVSVLTSCQRLDFQTIEKDTNERIKTWWNNESYSSRVKVDGRSRSFNILNVRAVQTLEKKHFAKTTDRQWKCCWIVRAVCCQITIES